MRKTLLPKSTTVTEVDQIISDKDLLWYIKDICGGMEVFSFETQEETRAFGDKLRKNCEVNTDVDIEVSHLTVRVRVGKRD